MSVAWFAPFFASFSPNDRRSSEATDGIVLFARCPEPITSRRVLGPTIEKTRLTPVSKDLPAHPRAASSHWKRVARRKLSQLDHLFGAGLRELATPSASHACREAKGTAVDSNECTNAKKLSE